MNAAVFRDPLRRPIYIAFPRDPVTGGMVAGMSDDLMEDVVTQLDRVLRIGGLVTQGIWCEAADGWFVRVEDDNNVEWQVWDDWHKAGMKSDLYYVHRLDSSVHRLCAGLEAVAAFIWDSRV